ncbi:hypothetical protein GCM10011316_16820 [Roseibium aquae]|uniref:Uncharacterized protein n=1 Tax=Roseibium aquae TaxID=1323746 RepID=A0A916THQ1_9HYPH|nr:hypothetical protein [Roseibium aquae]GGB45414.1 hypothetical protein GCM10011316_16820 [Roseibium aquae]
MKSYYRHLQSTLTFGEDMPADYRPTMRSSAAFPLRFEADTIDTEVTFMGYWLLKRQMKEVGIVLTVRDDQGRKLHVQHLVVSSPKAYVWRASALAGTGKIGRVFLGSVEVEVFSTRDMVYPYPAITFSFISPMGRAFVHTCGRIYNDLEDLRENDEVTVPEAGFDLIPDDGYEPFFSFVNGPLDQSGSEIELEFVNQAGQSLVIPRRLGSLPPYGTAWIRAFSSDQEREHLGSGFGTVKVRHDLKGFFPRLVAGNEHIGPKALSLTHSYYDTSSETGAVTYWSNSHPDAFHDAVMPVAVPAVFERVEIVIYPIYPRSGVCLHFDFYRPDGTFLFRDQTPRSLAEGPRLQYVNCRAIADAHGYAGADLLCRVIVEGRGKCPARLKFGINYGNRGRIDMPSNICSSASMANPKFMGKPGTFKWCSIFEPDNELIYLTNTGFPKGSLEAANARVRLWRHADDTSIEWDITVPWNGVLEVLGDRKTEISQFLGGEVGWMTFTSDNPFLNGFYITDHGHGLVGADHIY